MCLTFFLKCVFVVCAIVVPLCLSIDFVRVVVFFCLGGCLFVYVLCACSVCVCLCCVFLLCGCCCCLTMCICVSLCIYVRLYVLFLFVRLFCISRSLKKNGCWLLLLRLLFSCVFLLFLLCVLLFVGEGGVCVFPF